MGRTFDFGLAIFFFFLGFAVKDIPAFPSWLIASAIAFGGVLVLYPVLDPYVRLSDGVWIVIAIILVFGAGGAAFYKQKNDEAVRIAAEKAAQEFAKSQKDFNFFDVGVALTNRTGPFPILAMNYSGKPYLSVQISITSIFDFFKEPFPPVQNIGDLEVGLTPLSLPALAPGTYTIQMISRQDRFTETLRIFLIDGHPRQTKTVQRMSDGKVVLNNE